jgi:predicted GNAT family acetyltransferase
MNLTGFQELNIRHTSGAPDRWVRDAIPSLNEYVNKSTDEVRALLQASREKKVAKDEKGALQWLQERGFTKALAKSALVSAREEERGADPNASPFCVWNLVQGITSEARELVNNDDRADLEMRAGRLMKAVA